MKLMRWAALFGVCTWLAICTVARAEEPSPRTVVGTITSLGEAVKEPEAQRSGSLRVEEAVGSPGQPRVGETVSLTWQRKQEPQDPRRPGLHLGDQIRVTLQPSETKEAPAWTAVGSLLYLGRGELVNPGAAATLDLGSPQAKLLVKMFAPMRTDCHRQTADLLKALAQREAERVRLQLFDFYHPAAREEMLREGLTCATVLVNNRYEFTLKSGSGERKVQLIHRPNSPGATYNSEDAVSVVEQELKRVYPQPEPAKPASGPESSPASE